MTKEPLIQLGQILGVKIAEMKVNKDIRGALVAKASKTENHNLNESFETKELFFTRSAVNTFRGIHLQVMPHQTSKIITLVSGEITDYLVDLRENSSTFKNIMVSRITEENPVSIFVPSGIGHGYYVHKDETIVSYQYDTEFCQICDTGFSGLSIQEFLNFSLQNAILSEKDKNLPTLQDWLLSETTQKHH